NNASENPDPHLLRRGHWKRKEIQSRIRAAREAGPAFRNSTAYWYRSQPLIGPWRQLEIRLQWSRSTPILPRRLHGPLTLTRRRRRGGRYRAAKRSRRASASAVASGKQRLPYVEPSPECAEAEARSSNCHLGHSDPKR